MRLPRIRFSTFSVNRRGDRLTFYEFLLINQIRSPIIMIDDNQVFPPPSETFGTLAMKALWNVIRFDGNTDSSFHPSSLVDTRARAVDFLKFFFRRLTDILA